MNTYNIYKKRDGQSFKLWSDIYASNFDEAKKEFAQRMTQDNHNKSNNIQWLTKEEDGVRETGWYDFSGGVPLYNENTEKYDADEAEDFLFETEENINEGFDTWREDVHTWELRDYLDYEEIFDKEDMDGAEDVYEFLMVHQGDRYFIYNGDFAPIAEIEGFGYYKQDDGDYIGCSLEETHLVETLLENI